MSLKFFVLMVILSSKAESRKQECEGIPNCVALCWDFWILTAQSYNYSTIYSFHCSWARHIQKVNWKMHLLEPLSLVSVREVWKSSLNWILMKTSLEEGKQVGLQIQDSRKLEILNQDWTAQDFKTSSRVQVFKIGIFCYFQML